MSDDLKPATPRKIKEMEAFQGIYAEWLQARAEIANDEKVDRKGVEALTEAENEAFRRVLSTPAGSAQQVWMKWEVLENLILLDARDGMAVDYRAVMALGCVKADLLRFGFGS